MLFIRYPGLRGRHWFIPQPSRTDRKSCVKHFYDRSTEKIAKNPIMPYTPQVILYCMLTANQNGKCLTLTARIMKKFRLQIASQLEEMDVEEAHDGIVQNAVPMEATNGRT